MTMAGANEHPLLRTADGQDEAIRAHSRAVVVPVDLPPLRTSRLDRLREAAADEAQRVELEREVYRRAARRYGEKCAAEALRRQEKASTTHPLVGKQFVGTILSSRTEPHRLVDLKPLVCSKAMAEWGEMLACDEGSYRLLVERRGGCQCFVSPPCFACTDPLTEEEVEWLFGNEEASKAVPTVGGDHGRFSGDAAAIAVRRGNYVEVSVLGTSDADGWIPHVCTPTSVCPVPKGQAFEVRLRGGDDPRKLQEEYGDMRKVVWWQDCGAAHSHDIVAYRLLQPAKQEQSTPPIDYSAQWTPGDQIPESERKGGGLWHIRYAGLSPSVAHEPISFAGDAIEYRRAPDDAQLGDKYDERRYWQPNTGVQPVASETIVDYMFTDRGDRMFKAARAGSCSWCIGGITHWRLSREQK